MRSYLTSLGEETLKIQGLNEQHRISGLIHGLRQRALEEFLFGYLEITYQVVIDKAYTFLQGKVTDMNGSVAYDNDNDDHGHGENSLDDTIPRVETKIEDTGETAMVEIYHGSIKSSFLES